jgi:hypothetical protein
MRTSLVVVALLSLSIAELFAGEPEDNAAIVAATKSYVATNSSLTKITVTVEQVDGDFARAKVVPENPGAADPAWVFLKKTDGKWTGITIGTSFTTEDYQQLGIPNPLRIP